MTLKKKRSLSGQIKSGTVLPPKKKQKGDRENFFSTLADGQENDSTEETQTPNRKGKKIVKNNKKQKKAGPPIWSKGAGNNLGKYVKEANLVDIDTLIKRYIRKNNVEVIDGLVADQKKSNASTKTKVKTSELVRVERQRMLDERKHDQADETSEFFKDAFKIKENAKFEDFFIHPKLMKAIKDLNYETPTPIQAATIPQALAGKDICGCAATGTGKTAAYMLPTLQRLMLADISKAAVTRVLVLVPTRELGVQVFQVVESFAKNTNIRVGLACGGLGIAIQEKELLKRPEILIATPGRLLYFSTKLEGFSLKHIEVLILDEADKILDDYFSDQVTDLINMCSPHRQTLLFSATMTTEVKTIASAALKEPVKIFANSNTKVAQGLRQEYVVMKYANELTRIATILYLLIHVFNKSTLVFLPTRLLCHRVYIILRLCGLKVGELHSKLPQSARLRNLALFAKGEQRVLLATDLAARGLDIQGVETVINFKLNASYEMYVHRVGRTARAGNRGLAVSLVADREYNTLKLFKKQTKTPMYKRIVDKDEVQKWERKLPELYEICREIIRREKEAIRARDAAQVKEKVDKVVKKKEHVMERAEKMEKKVSTKGKLKQQAKAEGLSVEEYMKKKRLESTRISNSKKKKFMREEERKNNPFLTAPKKVLPSVKFEVEKKPFFNTKKKNKKAAK